jgi:glycosyltransferase involved in cell wall biosynthesis
MNRESLIATAPSSMPPAGLQDSLGSGLRRLLIVSYAFPPVGGAGVQRVTKFVKYLGRFSWQPTVLTVSNPSVPVFDQSLEKDVPPGTTIVRAASWEPNYRLKEQVMGTAPTGSTVKHWLKELLTGAIRRIAMGILQPDPQILWYPAAVREGRRLLQSHKHDAIVATAPPFSALLVGAALARYAHLPLIVDYRDEWMLSNKYWENKKLGLIAKVVQGRMERSVLRAADAVIATTRSSAQSMCERCQQERSSASVYWIYNGFDADDFSRQKPPSRGLDRFRLVYMGTLWNLTSVEPLVAAINVLSATEPSLTEKLDLVFLGRRTPAQAAHVESLRSLPCRVETHDYLDHSTALDLLCAADAGCLLLSDVDGADRVVPAKLFEYMASGNPILTIAPRGEVWELLDEYPLANRFLPNDTSGVAQWLAAAVAAKVSPALNADKPPMDLARFDREFQAGQLAKVLSGCCRVNPAGLSDYCASRKSIDQDYVDRSFGTSKSY